ncbi:MAG: OsmC family protein, partial [Gammaproteobacteria bacterium]
MNHENIKNLVGVKQSVEKLFSQASQDPSFGQFKYKVHTHWEGGVLCKAHIRNEHEIVVDEKPILGGCDLGASPVELILAALGTCQEIMYSVIASSMDIELRECDVNVTADLDVRGLLGVEAP